MVPCRPAVSPSYRLFKTPIRSFPDPDVDVDRSRNLSSSSVSRFQPLRKFSPKSVGNFPSYSTNRQKRQTQGTVSPPPGWIVLDAVRKYRKVGECTLRLGQKCSRKCGWVLILASNFIDSKSVSTLLIQYDDLMNLMVHDDGPVDLLKVRFVRGRDRNLNISISRCALNAPRVPENVEDIK